MMPSRCEYEAFGLVLTRRYELSNDARNKSDENDPKNVHVLGPQILSAFIAIEHTGAQGNLPWVSRVVGSAEQSQFAREAIAGVTYRSEINAPKAFLWHVPIRRQELLVHWCQPPR